MLRHRLRIAKGYGAHNLNVLLHKISTSKQGVLVFKDTQNHCFKVMKSDSEQAEVLFEHHYEECVGLFTKTGNLTDIEQLLKETLQEMSRV